MTLTQPTNLQVAKKVRVSALMLEELDAIYSRRYGD